MLFHMVLRVDWVFFLLDLYDSSQVENVFINPSLPVSFSNTAKDPNRVEENFLLYRVLASGKTD